MWRSGQATSFPCPYPYSFLCCLNQACCLLRACGCRLPQKGARLRFAAWDAIQPAVPGVAAAWVAARTSPEGVAPSELGAFRRGAAQADALADPPSAQIAQAAAQVAIRHEAVAAIPDGAEIVPRGEAAAVTRPAVQVVAEALGETLAVGEARVELPASQCDEVRADPLQAADALSVARVVPFAAPISAVPSWIRACAQA